MTNLIQSFLAARRAKRQAERDIDTNYAAAWHAINNKDIAAMPDELRLYNFQKRELIKLAIGTNDVSVFDAALTKYASGDVHFEVTKDANRDEGWEWRYSPLAYAICSGSTAVAEHLAKNQQVDLNNGLYFYERDEDYRSGYQSPQAIEAIKDMPSVAAIILDRRSAQLQAQAVHASEQASALRAVAVAVNAYKATV